MTHKNEKGTFVTHDTESLFYQHWSPVKKSKKAIIMFHRGHEHSERMKHIVEEIGLLDYHFFAWDARGHGESPGVRGFAPSVSHVVKDMDTFIKHISETYQLKVEDMVILGQSVGAVYVATWIHDYAPKVKACILASPAFEVKLYVPGAITGLRALSRASTQEKFVNSYVKGKFLSHDPKRIEEYNTDPSITRPISVNMLLDLYDTSKRIVKDAAAIETPLLMLVSGDDFVVRKEPQYEFFAKVSSHKKELYELPHFYHDTLGESNRSLAYLYIKQFLDSLPVKNKEKDLTKKNPFQFSYLELEALSQKGNEIEEKLFSLQARTMKFLSSVSKALEIGETTGYDSGSTLDYVYENKSTSDNPLGKLIDNVYLDAIGWKGIRVRKENLEKAFQWVYEKTPQLRFADIAAGHGRYDLDFLEKVNKKDLKAILSDYSDINVKAGTQMIKDKNLSKQVKFQRGDAFNIDYVKDLTQNTNLVVVSGLYELYPDNNMIENSLLGISEGIESGGYLVYTNQPWHPQLKFIAKVLTSHRKGEPWVMRRRSQAEMDQLVEKYGFEKKEQWIDQYGIFTVSIAQKK